MTMQIDRRVTNGLAWAGALIVVAIPTADLVSSQLLGGAARPAHVAMVDAPATVPAARIAPTPAPLSQRPAATDVAAVAPAAIAKPAAVAPAATPAAPAAQAATKPSQPAAGDGDVVSTYLNSGRKLPSYITGAAATPAPAVTNPPAPTAVPSQPVAAAPAPVVTAPAAASDPVVVGSIGPQQAAPMPMPLSMRPRPVATALTPAQTGVQPVVLPPAELTAEDLNDWETGPLAEFLAKRQGRAQQAKPRPAEYDADGFFLDQGPNRNGDRLIGPAEPEGFWGFQ